MSFAHKVVQLGDTTAGLPCKTEQKAEFFFTRFSFVVTLTSVQQI